MARTSSVYDHFDLYLTTVTLIYLKCFKWHFSSSRATTVPNCFEIHALLYKLWSGQIRTDARTHIHRTKIVTTLSRLPTSGLDKNNLHDGQIRIKQLNTKQYVTYFLHALWF